MSTRTCDNCNVAHGQDDLFCENCGYDFVTGSLPDGMAADSTGGGTAGGSGLGTASPAVAPVAPSVLAEGPAAPDAPDGAPEPGQAAPGPGDPGLDVPKITVVVAVDRSFFDEVVSDGELDFPDPTPTDQEVVLAGTEFHIGRTSESRAIHPDLDVADLTNDQAASSRHAILRVANDGSLTIVDVGSTNGTFLATIDSEAISHGVPYPVEPGTPIYVGAWTKLTVRP